jgi:hypothetical protein
LAAEGLQMQAVLVCLVATERMTSKCIARMLIIHYAMYAYSLTHNRAADLQQQQGREERRRDTYIQRCFAAAAP